MKKPPLSMPTILTSIAIVTAIGGGAWTLGKPPYANQRWAEEQLAGMQVQILQQRQDQLERRIYELRVERSRGRWSPVMEQELQRLERELRQLQEQIRRQGG